MVASDLSTQLETLSKPEEKIRCCLDFMKEALSQEGAPNFKEFWEARRICLPLFKEEIPPTLRHPFWEEYRILTKEGRELKEHFDEESTFAVEQIDLAIQALEEGIGSFDQGTYPFSSTLEFPKEPESMRGCFAAYRPIQQKLEVYQLFASRIHSLRKELIQTNMRVRHKNDFFQRLSTLGDRIFPQRKELLSELSALFASDVEKYVETHFGENSFSHEKVQRVVFTYREEIKALQAMAKLLVLSSSAFSATRLQLSRCWDQMKGMEKERKKQHLAKKHESFENLQKIEEKIAAFSEKFASGEISREEGKKILAEIRLEMRELSLTRADLQTLLDKIDQAKDPIKSQIAQEEEAARESRAELEGKRREKLEEFQGEVASLQEKISSDSIDSLLLELEKLQKGVKTLSASKGEKFAFDQKLRLIRDQIAEKRTEALLNLSEGDRDAIDHLKALLEEEQKRRKEMKGKIEELRKLLGGSGLSIAKSMEYNALMVSEKEKLGKLDETIEEIKQKIRAFT
ncbi:MAG: hypothetical protein K940chlam9_01298 [Chlamydiae bacterium]|nr:hypothetical protein [Chlamydiota bacterium]